MTGSGKTARSAVAFLVGTLALIFSIRQASGQETEGPPEPTTAPAVTSSDVKQLFVPADHPDEWPEGDWEVIGSQEYHRLLEGLKPKPPLPAQAAIEKATYQAVFTGENLTGGKLDFHIQRSGSARLLSLDPLNLAIPDLWWPGENASQKAAWGTTGEGRAWLVLPGSSKKPEKPASKRLHLQGEWSAAGRQLVDRVEFDLKFPEAAVTELELYLPEGFTLESSAGQTEGPLGIAQGKGSSRIALEEGSALRLWKVHLGGETECELGARRLRKGKPVKRLLLAESDTTYLVRERELQVEARFELEAAFAPLSQAVFHVPRSIRVFGVTYGGDANLAWRAVDLPHQKQIIIQLPDPLAGKSRPIRIQGLAQIQPGRPLRLPRITCPEASLLRGDSHLTVESPLELRSYELAGFRQTAIAVLADQRETFSFSQHASDANSSLTVTIGTPAFSASAQTVGLLTAGTEEWLMRTDITWSAQSGSRYDMTCQILPGWEILDVRRAGESALPVIADWRLNTKANPPQLTIEFLEAITPMQSRRVQILARRLPLMAEQSMAVTCVKPLGVRSVEQFLAVESDKGDIFTFDSKLGVQEWASNDLPAFVQNASIYQAHLAAGSLRDMQLFYSKGDVESGALSLKRSEPPYNALVEVLVDFTDQHIQETFVFSITPLEAAVDRLTILTPGLGEGWSWQFESETEPATRIAPPISTTPDALLEEGQPMQWDLKLPASQTRPFQILAKRQLAASQLHHVRLPFLPAARDFQGKVELTAPAHLPLDVESSFANEELLAERPEPAQSEILKRWHYISPDASLTVAALPTQSAEAAPLGKVTLRSLINGYSRTNLHRVNYELESNSRHLAFPFTLPEDSELIEVLVNLETVSPSVTDEGHILYYLPPGQKNVIEICYEIPWEETGAIVACCAPLPRTEVTVLDFHWQFALSPNLQLAAAPRGLALQNPPPAPHWTSQFFGPLGQGSRESFFAPWDEEDWMSAWAFQPVKGKPPEQNEEQFFPVDWNVYEAQGPHAPVELSLALWNTNRVRGWAWIALLSSLGIGVALRIQRIALRSQLAWLWLVLNLLGAGLLPWPWAYFCGGNITGTLIALVIPRVLLQKTEAQNASQPLGSTASFAHHPMVNVGVLLTLGLATMSVLQEALSVRPVFGQDAPLAIEPQINEPSPKEDAARKQDFNVMIPVDDPRNVKRVSSVVYVDRQFLKRLRDAQPKRQDAVDYLISNATFDADIHPKGSVALVAQFQVVLLSPHKTVQVRFPIENAFLGGPGHCLVDGMEHPVLSKAGVPGFFLELAPNRSAMSAIAEKPPGRAAKSPLVIRKVRLALHGVATLVPSGGRFQFTIPPIASSRFSATLPEAQASIKLRGGSRPVLSTSAARSLSGVTGAVRKLDLLWSQQPSELPAITNRNATVIASATVHPLSIEWQIRVKDQPISGTSNALWRLPRNTVVKAVKSDRLDSFQVLGENGSTRLLLKFQDPIAPGTIVDIHCMTPRDQSESAPAASVRLPALSLFPASAVNSELLEFEYLLGVNSSPELAIGPLQLPLGGNEFSSLTPEEFLSEYRLAASETIAIRPPQQAYRFSEPGELTLPVQLRFPAKRVRLNQEAHIGERDIRWTFTAEIETTGAKAFRHVLTVPANLLIESVSIQEDETERLVRWTKSGTRLELVLSDGTTAIQDVNVSGYVPIPAQSGRTIPLPLAGVENAEVVDSQLRISQDRALNRQLAVLGIEGMPPLEDNGTLSRISQSQLLAAVRLMSDPKPPVVVVGEPLEESRWEMALLIEPEGSLKARVIAILNLMNPNQAQDSVQLRLPPAMTEDFRVESLSLPGVIVPYETLPNMDQSLDLAFASASRESLRTLRIESLIDLPAEGPWEVPNLQWVRGELKSAVLLASPDFIVHAVDQLVRPEPLPLDELPGWFLDSQLLGQSSRDFRLFQDPRSSWRIETSPAKGSVRESDFVVRTTVWLMDSREISGRTEMQFPAQSLESLSWRWPEGTTLKGCLLDGKELSPAIDEQHGELHLLIPSRSEIKPVSMPRLLELHWSRELASPLARFGQIELTLPKPKDLPQHDAHLAMIPASHVRLIPESGIIPSENPSANQTPQRAANALEGQLPADSEEWTIAVWTMDLRTESFLLMGLVILVFAAGMNWAIRHRPGDWFQAHPGMVCFVLGALWWFAFAGSAFGFLLMAASPLLAWTIKKKTRPGLHPSH